MLNRNTGGFVTHPMMMAACDAILKPNCESYQLHVGSALVVVLQRLAPAERLAFVLHDLFGVSFEEIAGIVGRSPV